MHQGRLLPQPEPHQPESKKKLSRTPPLWRCRIRSFFMGPTHLAGIPRRSSKSSVAQLPFYGQAALQPCWIISTGPPLNVATIAICRWCTKLVNNLVDFPGVVTQLSYLHPPECTAPDSQYHTQTLQRLEQSYFWSSCIPIPRRIQICGEGSLSEVKFFISLQGC